MKFLTSKWPTKNDSKSLQYRIDLICRSTQFVIERSLRELIEIRF